MSELVTINATETNLVEINYCLNNHQSLDSGKSTYTTTRTDMLSRVQIFEPGTLCFNSIPNMVLPAKCTSFTGYKIDLRTSVPSFMNSIESVFTKYDITATETTICKSLPRLYKSSYKQKWTHNSIADNLLDIVFKLAVYDDRDFINLAGSVNFGSSTMYPKRENLHISVPIGIDSISIIDEDLQLLVAAINQKYPADIIKNRYSNKVHNDKALIDDIKMIFTFISDGLRSGKYSAIVKTNPRGNALTSTSYNSNNYLHLVLYSNAVETVHKTHKQKKNGNKTLSKTQKYIDTNYKSNKNVDSYYEDYKFRHEIYVKFIDSVHNWFKTCIGVVGDKLMDADSHRAELFLTYAELKNTDFYSKQLKSIDFKSYLSKNSGSGDFLAKFKPFCSLAGSDDLLVLIEAFKHGNRTSGVFSFINELEPRLVLELKFKFTGYLMGCRYMPLVNKILKDVSTVI